MVVSHMITYLKFGIPLFMTKSDWKHIQEEEVGVILYYIQNFSIFYCAVYSMYLLKRKKLKFYSLLGLFLIHHFFILIRGKISYNDFGLCLFLFQFFLSREKHSFKTFYILSYSFRLDISDISHIKTK